LRKQDAKAKAGDGVPQEALPRVHSLL
jgi:hypothetical protein